MNDGKYIGMDVHQATISVAVRDSRGNLVMEAILETKAETILQFIRGLRGEGCRTCSEVSDRATATRLSIHTVSNNVPRSACSTNLTATIKRPGAIAPGLS